VGNTAREVHCHPLPVVRPAASEAMMRLTRLKDGSVAGRLLDFSEIATDRNLLFG